MKTMTKTVVSSLLLALGAVLLVGCHTVEGVGRDVEAVGGGVADTADETRPYQGGADPQRR